MESVGQQRILNPGALAPDSGTIQRTTGQLPAHRSSFSNGGGYGEGE
jgi:hypothetical protein